MSINLSLNALKASYLTGETTPRELIKKLLDQAKQQSDFNAWIYLLNESELENYFKRLDQYNAEDLPLYGVPFAIKDNIDLAGIPTSAGCEAFTYIPDNHAHVIEQLINAGAIPLGKTNLDQFATGLVGVRSPFGQGKNVFNQDYISGGSSAGSAIATALGQVSFALGTDTAGSGRVPAAFNNLIGLKPTKGLLSNRGVVPACRTLDCISIFTLCADDAAKVLDIAADYDQKDAFARPNNFANKSRYFSESNQDSFHFAVPSKLDFYGNQECEALFEKSVDALIALGGEKHEIDFSAFQEAALLLYEGPWVAERWLATQDVDLNDMLPMIQEIIGNGNSATAADGFAAQYRLAELKRTCDEQVEQFDFIVIPTTPSFFTRAELDQEPIKLNSVLGTYTNFMNLLDYSAVAVPVGATECGVHWGVSLFSKAFKDIYLLNHSAKLQRFFSPQMGATGNTLPDISDNATAMLADYIDIIVCGAHLEGQPLNWQLRERGATLLEKTCSSNKYKLYALADGKRPGMVRVEEGGAEIEIEIWSMPHEAFGSFTAGIPAPLGIGKVETREGQWLCGFICENYGLEGATDITQYKAWRNWLDI